MKYNCYVKYSLMTYIHIVIEIKITSIYSVISVLLIHFVRRLIIILYSVGTRTDYVLDKIYMRQKGKICTKCIMYNLSKFGSC